MAQLEKYQAEWQRYAAELLGTFVLVFVGCTSIVGAQQTAAPVLLVAAFVFGIALLAGLYAFGRGLRRPLQPSRVARDVP
jgi:glycerol uptake facilitator-like aquaporin